MEQRQLRYRQKMNFVLDKLNSLPAKPVTSLDIDATLYRLQVAIEAGIDVMAMLVKDKGYTVSDDYHNLQQLADAKVISSALAEELKMLNSTRNQIVHRYNTFEVETILHQKETMKKSLIQFLKIVDHELQTNFGKTALGKAVSGKSKKGPG